MIYLTTAATLIFIAYLIWFRVILGYWSKSISMSFIDVKEKTGKVNWPFWIMIAMASITLCVNALHYWNLEWNFRSIPYLFLGGLGISGVNWLCLITKKLVKIMHMINAFLGFGISIFAFWINYELWYIPLLAAIFTSLGYWKTNDKVKILIAEIVMVLFIMAGLFIINIR